MALAERLIGKGFDIRIHDSYVKLSQLLGKNREFIEREIPHLDRLLVEAPLQALLEAELIVVGHADAATRALIAEHAAGRHIIDLAGHADLRAAPAASYEGICW